ncbi:MAG: ATP phosphoribosyltransferase regulatory subunit, partial [Firmicutes bacterium]|nr:ATP phosphoribosyltransferase regulatory subunit [Bacillota bacterium]
LDARVAEQDFHPRDFRQRFPVPDVREPQAVLEEINRLQHPEAMSRSLARLADLNTLLTEAGYGNRLRLDFSVLCDLDYYNGLVFRGFIRQLPSAVLSGGRYDKLMARFDKPQPATGFAVYWGEAERIFRSAPEFDADILLLYGSSQAADAMRIGDGLRKQGLSVCSQQRIPPDFRAKRTLRINRYGQTEEIDNA